MKLGEQVLTVAEIKAADKQYRETMTPENRPVRDDTITVFFIGLQLAGFDILQRKSGPHMLDVSGDCKKCQGRYCSKVTKDGVTLWACPFCNEFTEGEEV